MKSAVLVGLGGVLGTLTRYYVGLAFVQRLGLAFPYGTLFINATGCFILGLIGTLAYERGALVSPEIRLLTGVGFCGAYTTFSTFSFETMALLRSGDLTGAAFYVVASNVLGLAAAFLGLLAARALP